MPNLPRSRAELLEGWFDFGGLKDELPKDGTLGNR